MEEKPGPPANRGAILLAAAIIAVALAIGAGWFFWPVKTDSITQTDDTGEVDGSPPADADDNLPAEIFESKANAQLKVVGKHLHEAATFDWGEVFAGDMLADLRPQNLKSTYDDGRFEVFHQTDESATNRPVEDALAHLAAPLKEVGEIRTKFKVVSVEEGENETTTRVYFHAAAANDASALQQTAVWDCVWTNEEPPKIKSIAVSDFEEVINSKSQGQWFADCTLSAFRNEPIFEQDLAHSVEYWLAFQPRGVGIRNKAHYGLAVGDLNGDGLDDVYVCRPATLPNRLLIQQPDGTVIDRAAEAGLDWLDDSTACLIADFDNDGDQDLAVSIQRTVVFFANDGAGKFTQSDAVYVDQQLKSLSAADADNDGDLDVYVCAYGLQVPVPFHDADNGDPNMFLQNQGSLRFKDATGSVGLDMNNTRFSFAASWEDYDEDGDADLYVANDFGRNNLYENRGGKFVDVAAEKGVEDIAGGMSVDWGDANNDGHLDLYVGNMFSSAGSRITSQRDFRTDAADEVRAQYRRHSRGNTLFQNVGGKFEDISVAAGVTMGRWAWSSNFVDFNNDGREDIFVANGYITQEKVDDL